MVCFDCPQRPANGGACYVTVFQAPRAVWVAYRAGRYPRLDVKGFAAVFSARKIRFGAWGEPVLIPLRILRAMARVSEGWTGYTHQWRRREYRAYQQYLMASVDNPAEYAAAKELGWRTFRCRTADQELVSHEIVCPASEEAGYRSTCAQCRLCSGVAGPADPRKDIAIVVHGAKAKNFVALASIA